MNVHILSPRRISTFPKSGLVGARRGRLGLLVALVFMANVFGGGIVAASLESPGTFVVSSVEGRGVFIDETGTRRSLPTPLQTGFLTNKVFETGERGRMVLGLSNRAVLVAMEATKLEQIRFSQAVFSVDSLIDGIEPGASALELTLREGALAVVTDELRANSQWAVVVEGGHFRLAGGRYWLERGAEGALIAVVRGAARFTPDSGETVFVAAGQALEVGAPGGVRRRDVNVEDFSESARAALSAAVRAQGRLQVVAADTPAISQREAATAGAPRVRVVEPISALQRGGMQ